mmetsp:Transcript_25056/g.34778  ORF Transcript_25056/g.34778 Transcript_25056/m.34778 type:complete len:154 (-) Transcript_25056:91-552(-)|eukprot:jgi/Bigna1/90934/estExt_fgenesh1_pg.C_830042
MTGLLLASLVLFATVVDALSLHPGGELPQTGATYSFASPCELEATQFYCHIAPHDNFCKEKVLETCIRIKDKCRDFESPACSESEECCSCSFQDCPLEAEGCQLLARKCPGTDPTFINHIEIAKHSGSFNPNKIPIKINRPSSLPAVGLPAIS